MLQNSEVSWPWSIAAVVVGLAFGFSPIYMPWLAKAWRRWRGK